MRTESTSPATQPSSRNPWPVAIVAFFAFFAAATAGFIIFCSSRGVDLVSEDYYERGLRHQNQMDRLTRTGAMPTQVQVSYDPAKGLLAIVLPPEHARQRPTGRIDLYRPSAAALDRHLVLDTDVSGSQNVDVSSLARGLWRVRVSWAVGEAEFYCDQSLVITNWPG